LNLYANSSSVGGMGFASEGHTVMLSAILIHDPRYSAK